MEDMSAAPDGLDLPLPPDAQARLDRFKALTIRHPQLDQAERALRQAIWEPAGFAYVLLYGPSGVGKTTLVEHLATRLNQSVRPPGEPGTTSLPVLLVQTRPPDGELFHRTDYYRKALKGLGKTAFERRITVDLGDQQTWEQKPPRRKAARYPDAPELRDALEETLQARQVRAVILDEAQHLLKNGTASTPLDQLDWLKSMTNVTRVLHILVGPYELLTFCNLNGQTARRGLEIHFPRYQVEQETERRAFQNVLLTLLTHVPLQVDQEALLAQWWYFYTRSIGCVGILQEWLVRATHTALQEGSATLTMTHLEQRALSDAKCARMIADIKDGEDELHYSAAYRERLEQLLRGERREASASKSSTTAAPSQPTAGTAPATAPKPTAAGKVGQRAPGRDPVGDGPGEEPATKCAFSGALDLDLVGLTHAGIWKVECPVCHAIWTARVRGNTVGFPAHPPLRTRKSRAISRWVKQGEAWALVAAPA
jgi:energy-coupling factor transporter ATP-binding protein EcfA2